jgi:hypothetical protein
VRNNLQLQALFQCLDELIPLALDFIFHVEALLALKTRCSSATPKK